MRSLARFIVALMLMLPGAIAAWAVETPYIVVDMASGRVLSERNPHQMWYPASVTKLMNAYVVFKALRAGEVSLATRVIVSKNALAEPPSKMGFKVGTAIDLDNAMKMMLVHSSNDIAVAVAETVGGNEAAFVGRMNAEAERLGLSSTHFINPNGLPGAGQHSTARDLAVLARTIWTEFPEWRPIFSISAIQSGKRVLKSANNLLDRYPGTLGMKTGFICSSGFNVVAVAQHGSTTLLTVVLGMDNAKDRAELAARLMNDGFGGRSKPGPTLASFRGSSPVPYAIDMRGEICQRKDRGEHEVDAEAAQVSALVPKFKLMDPVPVTTLGMMTADGTIKAVSTDPDPAAPAAKKKASSKKATSKAAKKSGKAAVTAATGDSELPADATNAPAATPDATPASSAPATKKSTKKTAAPTKLEIGVPFDSTDIAPLPEQGELH
ncbi:D-alanyl-D-alanine carboxypeptidase [Mesorhizobium sp. BR1-1-16]|uniref:D-alanyl-D-alanine carboxypeptidase family protein n=1 Tax=Mesorhizobium sp. BR1-1-16 TaxID=2876653 RepID=UPI001CCFFC7B|nr:D-alanyl-D-alanine carboxypeptidase family protein [Mesorhizobium sp. BR1-1-16]MBZ9937410.1 D-alanyl-D-alanine carboxypeptidase [Mesorhizobium sp. BR1-1-16]